MEQKLSATIKNTDHRTTLALGRKVVTFCEFYMNRKLSNRHLIRQLKKRNPFFIHYARAIASLNNTYVTTALARQGLIEIRDNLKRESPFEIEIEIPAVNQVEVTKIKNKSKVVKILKQSIRTNLFGTSLISGVSQTESYLTDIMRIILQRHPQKLSNDTSSKTRRESKKIDIRDVLTVSSLEELYDDLIDQRLHTLMYASPSVYFRYLKDTIQIDLPESLVADFIEVKATRDVLVHNEGRVNQLYIDKAGANARTTNTKQNIPLSHNYFLAAFSTLKQVVRDTHVSASAKYFNLTKKRDLFAPPRKN